MLNSAWRTAVCVLIGLGLAATVVPVASADDDPAAPCADRTICAEHHVPGSTPTTGGGTSGGSGGGGTATCTWKGKEVACWRDDLGWFSEGCYYSKVDPQPVDGDEVWDGHTSKDGAVYQKACDLTGDMVNFQAAGQVFLAQAPNEPPKTPAQVAYDALKKITVAEPVLHSAPVRDAVVGSPVWLWFDRNPETVGPLSETLEGVGFKVTTTVTLAEVVWNVDDGPAGDHQVQQFTCQDAGNPFSAQGTPTCSRVFTASSARMKDKAYSLSVTLKWHVSSRSTDGTAIDMTDFDWWPTYTEAVLSVPVNEVQVLN
ncbi:hypothetical protein [Kitasatospora sp. NPDC057198]|uniref:hypothetical protein n=1 Tax=Kitasatospora sp. NPDC057198 TaxID=3346046 RepID=UPI00363BB548